MFESEVRQQLNENHDIFSKKTQNIVKRGVEYMGGITRSVKTDQNPFKKEQLKQEFIKYLDIVISEKFLDNDFTGMRTPKSEKLNGTTTFEAENSGM